VPKIKQGDLLNTNYLRAKFRGGTTEWKGLPNLAVAPLALHGGPSAFGWQVVAGGLIEPRQFACNKSGSVRVLFTCIGKDKY
jgi:hypothetical protein